MVPAEQQSNSALRSGNVRARHALSASGETRTKLHELNCAPKRRVATASLFVAGMTDLRQSLFEVIGQQWHAEQLRGGPLVMAARRFGTQFVPILDRAVAAPEPSKRDQIDLLIFGHREDRGANLLHHRI